MIAAVLYSASRGGFLCFLVAIILFYFLLLYNERDSKNSSVKYVLSLFLIIFFILAMTWSDSRPLLARITESFNEEVNETKFSRIGILKTTWKISQDSPLTGIGLGCYQELFFLYRDRNIDDNRVVGAAHNDYLQFLSEAGYIGFTFAVMFLSIFLYLVSRRIRERHDFSILTIASGGLASLSSFSCHSLVDFNFQIPANALLCFLVMGITLSTVYS